MAKLVQTVLLVAAVLWSGVCAAQCRALPAGLAAIHAAQQQQKPQQKKLPPCHQKQHQQQQQAPSSEDCPQTSCPAPVAEAESSSVALSAPLDAAHLDWAPAVQIQSADLRNPSLLVMLAASHQQAPAANRPPGANSVLRI